MSSSTLVPIACRFVPYDQWFVTHLDDKWKVKQVKHWILAKCNLQSSGAQTRRSVSPIVFAPTVRSKTSVGSLDDGYNEDDEHSEQDLSSPWPRLYPHRNVKPDSSPLTEQPGSSSLVDRYTLMSFSTGTMLEDEFTLSWYNLRPYELLEMHQVGTVAPLQRDVLAEYIQPYFQAKVKFLRVIWNHRSGRFEAPSVDVQSEHSGHTHPLSPKSSSFQPEKRRRAKVNWKTRWVVINQGKLSLCKEDVASPPVHQSSLSSMTALCGADALEHAFSIVSHPRVVCIRFRPRSASLTGVISPLPSSPPSPMSEDRRSSIPESLIRVGSAADLKQAAEQEDPREKSFEHASDSSDPFREDGEWVILDMLDDNAFSNILRILHREACQPISSSFAPSSSIIAVSPRSPDTISFSSYDTIPYPEWRIHTIENARKAGIGDVGKAMAWVLWSEKGLGESLMGNIRHHRQAFLQEMQYKTPTIPPDIYGPNDGSDDESEMEWEGWMRDLERQSQVKRRSGKVRSSGRQGQDFFGASSQLPSPPPSEASPCGSPRVRSPSLSMSHAGTGAQYRNIGHVIATHGYRYPEPGYSPEKMRSTIVSTVSVGTPPSRKRSSTLSTMITTAKGKQGRERVSSISENSAHATGSFSPRTPVRHARSSSHLRISSPCESDVGELAVPPVPCSPQSAFMRGMSVRAGKIVRGLESAIDFVDEER